MPRFARGQSCMNDSDPVVEEARRAESDARAVYDSVLGEFRRRGLIAE